MAAPGHGYRGAESGIPHSPACAWGWVLGWGLLPAAGEALHPVPGFAAAPEAAGTLLAPLVSSTPKTGLE